MTFAWGIFLVVVAVAVVLVIHWTYVQRDVPRIEQYLRARGATDIAVTWSWRRFLGGEQRAYDVRYNHEGRYRETQCVVPWDREDIYWKDPL